jgi:hypothetical protein
MIKSPRENCASGWIGSYIFAANRFAIANHIAEMYFSLGANKFA